MRYTITGSLSPTVGPRGVGFVESKLGGSDAEVDGDRVAIMEVRRVRGEHWVVSGER